MSSFSVFFFFFFNDTATTEIYTLSLHDALPIWSTPHWWPDRTLAQVRVEFCVYSNRSCAVRVHAERSEEHTSELQSHSDLVCRLLLEKKKRSNMAWKKT